ncbi:conserved hypothetical protein [Altererythrobacter sp. B11]|uniref:hypothetical protein n=1 Tax=Altererythrobacter sp. B11 TaxID=2060312 RepID=UPI000DC72972|nr:hypothetical protein [Altererythrobacter sp. B11]BBC71526.1 conserved hypothetical protein [Altererythrobacter sp. B11]
MKGWPIWAPLLAGAAALVVPVCATAQQSAEKPQHGYAELEKLPDFSGVWSPVLFTPGAPRQAEPVLTESAKAALAAFKAKQEKEGVSQYAQAHCLPPGMPGILRQPYPIEFLFTPGRVTIFTETYSQARRIYTDGRPLPEDPDFLFNGSSVGHWEGDTLVVDTIGFSPQVSIAPGVSHSDQMRIHERIWLEDPATMRFQLTITDPEVLAEPYIQNLTFKKKPGWEIREYVCAENNRLVSGEEGAANIDLGLDGEDDPFADLPQE